MTKWRPTWKLFLPSLTLPLSPIVHIMIRQWRRRWRLVAGREPEVHGGWVLERIWDGWAYSDRPPCWQRETSKQAPFGSICRIHWLTGYTYVKHPLLVRWQTKHPCRRATSPPSDCRYWVQPRGKFSAVDLLAARRPRVPGLFLSHISLAATAGAMNG